MAYNREILIGRITKIHSYDGSVTVRLEKAFIENIPEMESVFLEIEGRLVPFFISRYDYSGAEILKLTFEDYDSSEKIREFQGVRVFLTTTGNIKSLSQDNNDVTGYKIILEDKTIIGTIKEIIHNPGQSLLSVLSVNGKEILIPFHEDFISGIDPIQKLLIMSLPEGLIEIN
jgi:16S rRNA processing protein RimM